MIFSENLKGNPDKSTLDPCIIRIEHKTIDEFHKPTVSET